MSEQDDEADPWVPNEVTVVPLWRGADGILRNKRGTVVDLDADDLAEDTALDLASSAATLESPVDITENAIDMLSRQPVPECFDESGWLTDYVAVVFDHHSCVLDGLIVEHDPVVGLQVREVEAQ